MRAKLFSSIFLLVIIAFSPTGINALPTSHFTTKSKLSSGKWAKISITETGVHEITAKQLTEMGFNDLSKVKIFGRGGYALSEILNSSQHDDLTQIPIYKSNNKVIFFAQGTTEDVVNNTSDIPYHTIKVNPYTLKTCYFITDSEDFQPLYTTETSNDNSTEAAIDVTTSYSHITHNKEQISFLNSGKTFYGEDLTSKYSLDFTMPHYVKDTPIALAFSVGAASDEKTTVSASINGTSIELNNNSIAILNSNRAFEIASPYGFSSDIALADKYSLSFEFANPTVNTARLDYFTITYQKENIFPTDSSQLSMDFLNLQNNWNIIIENVNEPIIVWNITDGVPQMQHSIIPANNNAIFQPSLKASHDNYHRFIAFKPRKTLKSVKFENLVENQNLHGYSTPDMVIIYPRNFKKQAEKLALIHHNYDGYDVLAVEEEQIFNEFSSGTKDATAYRLFLKMLYDRNPQKLKYLLLLGCGSYDNRGINGIKSENLLLTYQSNDSQGIVSSYTTDDYFGFLADGSGSSLPSDILTIAVGRIPAKDNADADAAIGKLVDYITDSDYTEWKNQILIISDEGDNELHTTQAEGLEQTIRKAEESNGLYINKLYQDWYMSSIIKDNELNGAENIGRDHLQNILQEGVLYVSYIGHGGPVVLTFDHRLWTSAKIKSTKYNRLPFFALAACETAKFDDNGRSFCEELVLANEGGAIGVLAAARTVYSSQNDRLNKALGEILFTLNDDGSYHTIGEASMKAKKTFGTSYNYNKLSFTLFGDPALRFRFPLNRCKVTHINDNKISDSSISTTPLSTIIVKGYIANDDGTIDNTFNGEATISVFDKAIHYKDLTSPSTKVVYSTYYPREKLCHSTGEVKNGEYNIAITLPANCQANGDTCEIRVYAQSKDNRIVSGTENRFIINSGTNSITDINAPQIKAVSIDGQDASHIVYASSNPIIQFSAIDDIAINTKPNDLQGSMKIIIDNGKQNIPSLSNYATATDGGKTVSANIKLHNLSAGRHTLHIEVSDYAGNTAQKEVIFYVTDDALECSLSTSAEITTQNIEFNLETTHHIEDCTLFIRDCSENTVTTITNDNGSFSWNLKDANGYRVKSGRYTVFATFVGDEGSGVTEPIKIIVLNN